MTTSLRCPVHTMYNLEFPGSFCSIVRLGAIHPGMACATKVSNSIDHMGRRKDCARLFNIHMAPEPPPYHCRRMGML